MEFISHSCEEVKLIPVPGIWISKDMIVPPVKANLSNSQEIMNNLRPRSLNSAIPDNKKCIIPVMPAVPPFIDSAQYNDLKMETSAPLKHNSSPSQKEDKLPIIVRGYRSGRRSAIIHCKVINNVENIEEISNSDKTYGWIIAKDISKKQIFVACDEKSEGDNNNKDEKILIRIKGCGMWLDDNDTDRNIPFPAITLNKTYSIHAKEEELDELYEIRGVCFPTTSSTEIYFNSIVEDFLHKLNLQAGNQSIGFWNYVNLIGDLSPSVQKSVSIFRTLGDRRLESHLLAGLEKLISKVFTDESATEIIELLKPLYKNPCLFPSNENRSYTKVSLLRTNNFREYIENNFIGNIEACENPLLNDDSLRNVGIIPTNEIYQKLATLNNIKILNFVRLFGRLGFETGRSLAAVHRSGLLWGSYTDHNMGEFHCNSHCDNLIVLPMKTDTHLKTKEEKMQLLAPLDFDMAFKKENSINVWKEKPEPDPEMVTANVSAEFKNMLMDIAGEAASVPGTSTAISNREAPKGLVNHLLWICRDCSSYELIQGYQRPNSGGTFGNDISVIDAYELIELALKETINDQS